MDSSPTPPRLVVERLTSWESFRTTVSGPKYKSWAFRGQSNAVWPLFSSLSRYLKTFGVHQKVWPSTRVPDTSHIQAEGAPTTAAPPTLR